MRRIHSLAALLAIFGAVAAPAAHAEVAGRATVIDGDTIEIAGLRVRLHGIDAPEAGQTCVADAQWRCGQQAAFALAGIIGSHWVHCAERDRDHYQRIVAVCHLSGSAGPTSVPRWCAKAGRSPTGGTRSTT